MSRDLNPHTIIEKYYSPGSELYHILLSHSQQVQQKVLSIARNRTDLALDLDFLSTASLLHDIGIIHCNAANIHCYGNHHYIEHGYLGAEMLNKEGLHRHALVCERHTGVGISLETIVEKQLPLPKRDMRPVSLEEKLICYADKFFSKTKLGETHTAEKIKTDLLQFGQEHVNTFIEWQRFFEGKELI